MKREKTNPSVQIEIPLDIALFLLRPDELAKLKKYVAAYIVKYQEDEEQQKDGAKLSAPPLQQTS